MDKYGLIGKDIEYSFSRVYFTKKFEKEELNASYVNFDCKDIEELKELLKSSNEVKGYNVTIPYKEKIMPLLQDLNKHAQSIGAVNTVKRLSDGRLKGYNTDYVGFQKSIEPYLTKKHDKALILGTGGASKAIAYALELKDIDYTFVSRNPNKEQLGYTDLNAAILSKHLLIINCSPVGTYPHVDQAPTIPYRLLSKEHLVYDLVYNPAESRFLKNGKEHGATAINGLSMLELQAEAAWKIWN
ncbi:MAG: shikimate dehydrogenase [Leeuwenhoekiella sp.]